MTGVPHDLDLGALLAEQAFVRRLARSLVFDQARVDDVVQETWLAAMRSPLRDARAARPFLRRVVQAVASNFARGEARRRRREAQVTLTDAATPSVADAFERESVRQQVVQELAALAEPYRSTLVLRFFEDLQPGEIAARTKVPAATVRTRLKRGLDTLRARLDARHGGDGRAWALALLPLARGGKQLGVAAGTGLIGILAMKKLWLLAVLVLLCVGTWAWQPWAGPTLPEAPTFTVAEATTGPAPAASTPAADAPQRAAVPAPTPEPEAAAAPRPSTAALRGRVVAAAGAPAPGQTVRVVGIDVDQLFVDERGVAMTSEETQSAADGTFTFASVPVGALLAMHAGVDGDRSAFVPVRQTPTAGVTVDVGDVVLEERGTVVGRVEDEDGEGVAGATVWAADLPALVTLAVNIERFDPAHGGMMALPAPQPGETSAAFAGRLSEFLNREFLMQVLPEDTGRQVHVVATPPWVQRLWEGLPIARTRTRADGSFELRDVPPGTNLLVARKPGLDVALRTALKVGTGSRTDAGTLTLEAGESLAVEVLDSAGSPVAAARVRVATLPVAGFRGIVFCEAEARTDARGRAYVEGLPRGRVLVAARRDDEGPWTTLPARPVQAPARVTLPAASSLRVHVRTPGTSVPRFTLRQGPPAGELARMGLLHPVELRSRLRPEPEGRFVIDRLSPGTYVLDVAADGCVDHEVLLSIPQDETVEVDLSAAAPAFDVLVTDSANAPIAGARVCAEPTGDGGLRRGVLPTYFGLPHWRNIPVVLGHTDAAGRLRVRGLAPGEHRLWAAHAAHSPGGVIVQLPAQVAPIRLERPATLTGTITERGSPIDATRWHVTVTPRAATDPAAPTPLRSVSVDADGRFIISGLAAGLHHIEIQPAFTGRLSLTNLIEIAASQIFSFGSFLGGDTHSRDVVLSEGAKRDIRIDLDLSHEMPRPRPLVTGRVTVDGAAARDARVVLVQRFLSGGSTWSMPDRELTKADAEGNYSTDGLQEGRQELGFVDAASGQHLHIVELVLQAGEQRRLDVDLQTGSIRGRVVPPAGRTLDEAVVAARSASGATAQAAVAADGTFELRGIVAGDWNLAVKGRGMATVDDAPVALAAGQTARGIELAPEVRIQLEVAVDFPDPKSVYVSVQSTDGRFTTIRGSGDSRACVFPNLAPGRYKVGPMEEDQGKTEEIALKADGPAVRQITLSPQGLRER